MSCRHVGGGCWRDFMYICTPWLNVFMKREMVYIKNDICWLASSNVRLLIYLAYWENYIMNHMFDDLNLYLFCGVCGRKRIELNWILSFLINTNLDTNWYNLMSNIVALCINIYNLKLLTNWINILARWFNIFSFFLSFLIPMQYYPRLVGIVKLS